MAQRIAVVTDSNSGITQLQAEGGKRMGAADYFRGHPMVF